MGFFFFKVKLITVPSIKNLVHEIYERLFSFRRHWSCLAGETSLSTFGQHLHAFKNEPNKSCSCH